MLVSIVPFIWKTYLIIPAKIRGPNNVALERIRLVKERIKTKVPSPGESIEGPIISVGSIASIDKAKQFFTNKGQELRTYWEGRLDAQLPENSEVWPIVNYDEELFDRVKFKKQMRINTDLPANLLSRWVWLIFCR